LITGVVAMAESNYNVNGSITFPLNFEIKSSSAQEALMKAIALFNDQVILKVELDVYTQDGKCHLIIADELSIYWTSAEKTNK